MPIYLLHGFRWDRALVRIHIILQNLEEAAAEWLAGPQTAAALRANFQRLYPNCMQYLPQLRFIEPYDPADESAGAASQPYAYIADIVEEVKLDINVDELRGRGVGNDQWSAIMELRDVLCPEQQVAWYVVYCGDEERLVIPLDHGEGASSPDAVHDFVSVGIWAWRGVASSEACFPATVERRTDVDLQKEPQSPVARHSRLGGFKKFFAGRGLARRPR